MATQISATTQPARPALRFGVLEAAIVTVIAVALIALAIWTQTGSGQTTGPMSAVDLAGHYGVGYPLHGGLAGPSRAAQVTIVDGPGSFAAGYPLRGGLAGPSRVGLPMSAVDLAGHYGPGYPLHGGLAGPSRGD